MKKIDSAILIALITGYLYASGITAIKGSITGLGLDVDVIGVTLYRPIYEGFLLNIMYIFYFCVIVIVMFIFKVPFSPQKLKFKYQVYFMEIISDFKNHRILFSSVFIFSLFILSFASLYGFEKKAYSDTDASLKNIFSGDYTKVTSGEYKDLALLYCGSKNCAAYNIKTNRIHYFPPTNYDVSPPYKVYDAYIKSAL